MKPMFILLILASGLSVQADQVEIYQAPQVEIYKEVPGYRVREQDYEVYEQEEYDAQFDYQNNGERYVERQPQRGYLPPFRPMYKGQCNVKQDPHSYACHDLNFFGNNRFPLYPMIWYALEGPWFAVSYANPRGRKGKEFFMDVNPNRPSQPRGGVINQADKTQMGIMEIRRQGVAFHNWEWAGGYVESDPGTLVLLDDGLTVEFQWVSKGVWHGFQCRDFNRNDEHHLNCQWSVWNGQNWDLKGYLGFIKLSVWERFVNGNMGHQSSNGHHQGPPPGAIPHRQGRRLPPGLF